MLSFNGWNRFPQGIVCGSATAADNTLRKTMHWLVAWKFEVGLKLAIFRFSLEATPHFGVRREDRTDLTEYS
jgi:hypothetical protein